MKRLLLPAVIGACLVALLVPATSSAYSRSNTCTASCTGGSGTLYGTHYYNSKDSTHWYNTSMSFHCTGTRSSNNVEIWLYNGATVLWHYNNGAVVGGRTYKPGTYYTSLKGVTKSHWYFVADINNWPDPDASMNIGPF